MNVCLYKVEHSIFHSEPIVHTLYVYGTCQIRLRVPLHVPVMSGWNVWYGTLVQ